MTTTIIAIIIVVIILLYYFYPRHENYVVEGINYGVSTKYSNGDDAAEALHYLNMSNIKLMRHLRNKYKKTTKMNDIQYLLNNYNPEVIFEHIPKGTVNTSFVVEKGKKVGYCLREKKSGKDLIHDRHTLMFVNLHELSHMYNQGWGHERDFWQSFKFILQEAKEIGIHEPKNYMNNPIVYCGLRVAYNPYFDENL